MAMKVTTKLNFDIRRIAQEYEGGVVIAERTAAKAGEMKAKAGFLRKHKGTGTGQMAKSFSSWKSRYKNGGWLFGVKGSSAGPWPETVGGRAVFFEYGRSAPGRGKTKSNRWKSQAVRQRPQPPRPFMRPARNWIRAVLGGMTSNELRRVARKVNRFAR